MKNMSQYTIIFGILLVIVGVGAYFYSGQQSKTALIPAFYSIPIFICGFFAMKEKFLKHAMHAAAGLGLLGVLASFRGLLKLPAFLAGEELERPLAVVAQSAMSIVCIGFVILCVLSFIKVRKEKALSAD